MVALLVPSELLSMLYYLILLNVLELYEVALVLVLVVVKLLLRGGSLRIEEPSPRGGSSSSLVEGCGGGLSVPSG